MALLYAVCGRTVVKEEWVQWDTVDWGYMKVFRNP